MRDLDLFQLALGVQRPWYVRETAFDVEHGQLDIHIDFKPGGTFACPECGRSGCTAYDTSEKTWRHLNFFEHEAYLHVRTPRVQCERCGVKRVDVPWGRHGSGFTLMFEAYVLTLCREMPVAAVARLVREHDTRLWRVLHHYVEEARERVDFSTVQRVGVDETASRRGHDYISLFVDLDEARVLFACEGRDAEVLNRFRSDLEAHGGRAKWIRQLCMDMSPAYLKGAAESFPEAEITFDKFHVVRLLNDAVEAVRRAEQKERPELKGSRYTWVKNPQNWTRKQALAFETLAPTRLNLKTARAYRIRLAFQEFYSHPWPILAEKYLERWYAWAIRSRLPAIVSVAKTVKRHWQGIVNWFWSGISNGLLEGINSLIQAAKARARGYRSTRNLVTMVYMIAGKLDLQPLPI